MCIHAIRPTQPRAAFASRQSRRIDSALVITGVVHDPDRDGLRRVQRGGHLPGVLVDRGAAPPSPYISWLPVTNQTSSRSSAFMIEPPFGRGPWACGRTREEADRRRCGAATPRARRAPRAASSGRTSLRKSPVAVSTLARIFVVVRLRWNGKNSNARCQSGCERGASWATIRYGHSKPNSAS